MNYQLPQSEPSSPTRPSATDSFLVQVGVLLHQHGTPAHRLERVLSRLAQILGVEGVFLYTPTALVISIKDDSGEATYLRRVESGEVDVDKLIKFDETLERVEARELPIAAASLELDAISNADPPYPHWITIVACAISCAAVAVFFRGTAVEIVASGCLGMAVALLELIPAKLKWEQGLLEPIAGSVAAVGALAISRFVVPIDDRLVTLAALIIMIPGLRITVALTELAVGHLSAGIARLAGACVSLLTLTVGVAIGWRVAENWRNIPAPMDASHQFWWPWVAIAIAPITFAIVFRARWPQWPVIVAVSVSGFACSLFAGRFWGIEVGAFCGALAVGFGSNLYARLRDRPALVPLTPGIIVLVPGSLGYRSLTAFLDHDTMIAVDFAFNMAIVAVALVGGILLANVLLPPRRIL